MYPRYACLKMSIIVQHYLRVCPVDIVSADLMCSSTHFLKSVTQCCPPSGRIVQSACHWMTHSFKIIDCLLLADTVVSCQSVSQLSHQPRPVASTLDMLSSYMCRQAQIFPHISYQKLIVCLIESAY